MSEHDKNKLHMEQDPDKEDGPSGIAHQDVTVSDNEDEPAGLLPHAPPPPPPTLNLPNSTPRVVSIEDLWDLIRNQKICLWRVWEN